ncbi:hypothetical protein ACJJH9_05145 [Microbulbifer sp. DLAB2-AF]|uniref:hypothetical protein n=1 Tax=Microbulbifer sp. DLAB2-AF TaxID=3243395 RepID=UPI004039F58A
MKSILIVVFLVLVAGCTSRIAMLQTDNPEENEYRFIFGKMILDYDKAKSMSPEARAANYENQLNLILRGDKNTSSCSIVPGTVNFGEPGSQGTARVRCKNPVSVQVQEDIFNRDGSPFYSYTLPNE